MYIRTHLKRLLGEKQKICVMMVLIILPLIDLVQGYLFVTNNQLPIPNPYYATFLVLFTNGHIWHLLFFWFLPIYMLVILSEDIFEDYNTGYVNILKSKIGKNKYVISKILKTFTFAFLIVFLALLLNLIGNIILFHGGEYLFIDPNDSPENLLYTVSNKYPLLTNLIYSFVVAFTVATISVVGSLLAMVIKDRKLVYATIFCLWFLPIYLKNSLMYAFQPFSEYGFNVVLPTYLGSMAVYIVIIITLIFWEAKCVKI